MTLISFAIFAYLWMYSPQWRKASGIGCIFVPMFILDLVVLEYLLSRS